MRSAKGYVAGALLALMVLVPAFAPAEANRRAALEKAEFSMILTGEIEIDAGGALTGYTLDKVEEVDPTARRVIEAVVPSWRFEPVQIDGVPHPARAPMRLLVVASPVGDGQLSVQIRSARFGDAAIHENRAFHRQSRFGQRTDVVRSISMQPPTYPTNAAREGVQGDVYLIVKVGPDGNVQDLLAEQVNLRTYGTENQMVVMRRTLSNAAMRVARRWTFQVPTTGEDAGKEAWLVRVPVQFYLGQHERAYGQWAAYIPGPRESIPGWADEINADGRPETLVAGTLHRPGTGLKLLNSLEGGS